MPYEVALEVALILHGRVMVFWLPFDPVERLCVPYWNWVLADQSRVASAVILSCGAPRAGLWTKLQVRRVPVWNRTTYLPWNCIGAPQKLPIHRRCVCIGPGVPVHGVPSSHSLLC